jgi:hypothetical protein
MDIMTIENTPSVFEHFFKRKSVLQFELQDAFTVKRENTKTVYSFTPYLYPKFAFPTSFRIKSSK